MIHPDVAIIRLSPRTTSLRRSALPNGALRLGWRKILIEPVARELRDLLERAGLLEQVCRTWDNLQELLAVQLCQRLLVHADHRQIVPADDQQRGRANIRQSWPGASRPAATRDARIHNLRPLCRA